MRKRILSILLAALMILTALPLSSASANVLGDIDGDGKPTSSDARLALRASVGLETIEGEKAIAADVDFDEKITSSDARLILRASVGLETLQDPHTHSYKESITKAATCTEKGTKTFTCECGDSYTEEIAATGHTAVTDTAVAPTCTETGKTEGSHCSVCETVINAQTNVPATGHVKSSIDASTVKEVNCKEDGYSGDYKCDVCKTVTTKGSVIETTGKEHILENKTVPASCTQDGYTADTCKYCDNYFDANSIKPTGDKAEGHKYSTPKIVDPTCTEQGYTVEICSVCEDTLKTNYTDAAGHKYDWNVSKAASCKETGLQNGKCSECGDETEEVIPLTACEDITETFTAGDANTLCKVIAKCNKCEKIVAERNAENYEHRLIPKAGAIPTVASCTEPSIVDIKCDYCYLTIDDYRLADPNGHNATVDKNNTKAATCTEEGKLAYTGVCSVCEQPVDNADIILPAKGHKLTGVQTCTTAVSCSVCKIETASALGHDYTLPANAAVFNTAVPTFFCNRCGEEKTDKQDKIETFNEVTKLVKNWHFTNTLNNTIAFFDKTSVDTTYSHFDFGRLYTPIIREMYEEEMANTPDEFSPLRNNYPIRTYLPVNQNTVSELTEDDIDSITVDKLSGINISDILASYPNSYTYGTKTYDLTPYKNKTINEDVIKVTVDVKNEKYSVVKNLDSTEKTALEKIYDFDIREAAEVYRNEQGELKKTESDKGEGYEITMTMELREISTDATVVYYFAADTYEPILAIYNTNNTMDQTIDMLFRIALFSLNGELDPIITTTTSEVYFFSGYFAN